jgi:hypothetical protein
MGSPFGAAATQDDSHFLPPFHLHGEGEKEEKQTQKK